MRRRDVIAWLGGGAATAWPLRARAQQAGKLPTIGFLGSDAAGWRVWTDAFATRLRELGWIEGRTIAIEYRWDEGRPDQDAEIAAEFVRLKVDAIVASGSAVVTVKQATATIPIVFALANDPLGGGLVASLARPGGNVTGLSVQSTDLAGKRIQLLREVVPQLRRLAVMADANDPGAVTELGEVQAAGRTLGLEVAPLEIRGAKDIAPAFKALNAQADALYVGGSALTASNRTRINTFTLIARLPAIFQNRDWVEIGGLMSYGPNVSELFRRAAEMVDKILRGTKPGDIPVEQPTKFEFVVNLATADALGLTFPDKLLATANEVIE
jgi:putative tryptophan/tyrosine transport system substrate-binding protein